MRGGPSRFAPVSNTRHQKFSARKPQPQQASQSSQQIQHRYRDRATGGNSGGSSNQQQLQPQHRYAGGGSGHDAHQQQRHQHLHQHGDMNPHESDWHGSDGDINVNDRQRQQYVNNGWSHNCRCGGNGGNGNDCQRQQYVNNGWSHNCRCGGNGGNGNDCQRQQYVNNGGDENCPQHIGHNGRRPYIVYDEEKQQRYSYHGYAINRKNLRHKKIENGEYVSIKCMKPPKSIEVWEVMLIWGETKWHRMMSNCAITVEVGTQQNGSVWLHVLDKNMNRAFFNDIFGRQLAIVAYTRANFMRKNMQGLVYLGILKKVHPDDVKDRCCDQAQFFTEIPLGSTVVYEDRHMFTGDEHRWSSVGIVKVIDLESRGKWTKRLECPNCTPQQQWINYQACGHIGGRFRD